MIMEKPPWLDEYEWCGLPLTLAPYPEWPVFRLLENAARNFPNRGLVQTGRELKYPEVLAQSCRLAAALAGLGVKKGDRVATILPTSIQFVISDYAISRAGAVHVPSSFLEPPHVLAHKFKQSSPKALIYLNLDLESEWETVAALCAETGIKHLILTRLEDYSLHPPPPNPIQGFLSFTELIARSSPDLPLPELQVDRDLETLLFTGGTTGLPKGCMLTHQNILANALQSAAHFEPINLALNGNFSALLAIPFFHAYGHIMMHTMTHLGVTQLLVPDPRDTRAIIAAIKENYPLFQFGVPAQYLKMCKEELDDVKVLGISGSAALPTQVQEQFEEKGGGGLMEGYGLSECSPNTHLNPSLTIRLLGGRDRPAWVRSLIRRLSRRWGAPLCARLDRKTLGRGFARVLPFMMRQAAKPELQKDNRKGSIGVPFHDTRIKVIDESGAALSFADLIQGRIGEMCIAGPQVMLGYWPNPGEGLDPEGFVHTGDVARMDERGYFYVVDRIKDMINVSGYKVYSRELDDILYGHPAVEAAAAIGVPNPDRPGSELVKVVIQLKDEFRGRVAEEDFREFLKDKVAKYAQPRFIEFLEALPLTGVQKVDKKALRARGP